MASSSNISCFYGLRGDFTTLSYIILHDITNSLAIALNVAVVSTICSSNRLRTATNATIVSLAASDLAYSIQSIVSTAIAVNVHENQRCDYLSKIFIFTRNLGASATYLNLLLISIERWLFIARPFVHQRVISPKLILRSLILVWTAASLVNIDIFILNTDLIFLVERTKLCIVFPCLHVVLSIILCGIYVHLSVIVRRQIHATSTSNIHPSDWLRKLTGCTQAQMKIRSLIDAFTSIRLLVVVFGAFFLLMTPGFIFYIYEIYYEGNPRMDFYNITKELSYLHCCCNFFVVARHDATFRRALFRGAKKLRVWHCCKRSNS